MLKLTPNNYHSIEANQEYMSVSQYKGFLECEAKEYAKVFGGWEEDKNEVFLVGQYLHSWNEGLKEEFKANTYEMFKKNGEMYAKFLYVEQMTKALENDPLCMKALEGEKELIFTAELFGTTWKIRVDSLNIKESYFSDLKGIKSLHDRYYDISSGRYVSFVEYYFYTGQMAVYQTVLQKATNKLLEPYIVAVTKETPPNKAVIKFDEQTLKYCLEEIEFHLPRILQVKSGQVQPKKCGKCEYCREIKKAEIIHYLDLI